MRLHWRAHIAPGLLTTAACGASRVCPATQVAETFTFSLADGAEVDLSDLARLDTCVTVVDAANFRHNWTSPETVCDRFNDVADEDERNVVDLMTDQLEFADVIIVNKADLVSPEELKFVEGVVRKMNSHAKVLVSTQSKVRARPPTQNRSLHVLTRRVHGFHGLHRWT